MKKAIDNVHDIDYRKWRRKNTWQAWEAILLICNINPIDLRFFNELKSCALGEYQDEFYQGLLEKTPNFVPCCEVICDAIMNGSLNYRLLSSHNPFLAKGAPQGFLQIAKENGIGLSEKLEFIVQMNAEEDIRPDLLFELQETISGVPDYLNPGSEYYAPRLHAAIDAWAWIKEQHKSGASAEKIGTLFKKWIKKNGEAYCDSRGHKIDWSENLKDSISLVIKWDSTPGPSKL